MSDIHPATPMGSPAATTPVEALAAELETVIAEQREAAKKLRVGHADRDTGLAEARGTAYAAALVRERLAPAWDALAAENAQAEEAAYNAGYSAGIASLREQLDAHREDAKAARAHLRVVSEDRDSQRRTTETMTAERDRLVASSSALQLDLSTARQERDQLQAAHNAVAGKNAELAAELERLRRDREAGLRLPHQAHLPGAARQHAAPGTVRGRAGGLMAVASLIISALAVIASGCSVYWTLRLRKANRRLAAIRAARTLTPAEERKLREDFADTLRHHIRRTR